MEEVIEALREKALIVSAPIRLPVHDDLLSVEEEILIAIPYELREFLSEVSDVVYGSLEPVTVTDPNAHTHLPEVAATAWNSCVPRHLVPFCQDGNSYYCIGDDAEVSLWSPDGQSDQHWISIWDWAQDVWLNS